MENNTNFDLYTNSTSRPYYESYHESDPHSSYANNSRADDFTELPEGLAMAFAQDTAALGRFTSLSIEDQNEIIRRARAVSTRDEMRRLVSSISSGLM